MPGKKEGRTSFLKKRSKKLLIMGTCQTQRARKSPKVFWFFFSKKNRFLA